MPEQFASGWENPDCHEPLTARPRPMFDETGKAVTEAPPPQPEPLDEILRPGDIQPAAGGRVDAVTYEDDLLDTLNEIERVAKGAADSERPLDWALALGRIVELAAKR